ncbi:hypothetical protein LMH73_013115 [Vibrio splendidus]|nr:hypothetical protein [Vibrio splendidus]MCC4880716.1 hypothetical protein [Vibrio splendidus]
MKKILVSAALACGLTFTPPALSAVDDRILHTGASMIVGSGMMVATNDRLTSYSMCAAVGIAKELYDEMDYGGASAKDLFFDALGCVIGVEGSVMLFGVDVKPTASSDGVGVNLNYSF